jgi:hypothetical protein
LNYPRAAESSSRHVALYAGHRLTRLLLRVAGLLLCLACLFLRLLSRLPRLFLRLADFLLHLLLKYTRLFGRLSRRSAAVLRCR